ncbi:holo-ACP synthase [Alkalihalobacillus sp. LMS39]|uniref:holo-ACP synthase n=1 Tax=Alkalihalobacillus sp. LMS39 TaxID=2924032 RepID=UPI001FB2D393|nr:holo-ACP synthase [Alkalihalobacillus sp. LMS39]UOE94358.1 holo-ACP synthase [Alkalihalobacillus sp. LMS39]
MIQGVGIDIIELERIKEAQASNERFVEKILTPDERTRYDMLSAKRKVEYLAGRFAAKEAFVKAAGTGISKRYGWQDIQVLSDERGKPYIPLPDMKVHVSISHSKEFAVAQVIIESIE